MDIVSMVFSALLGGVLPAVAVVATIRAQVGNIRLDLRDLKHDIIKAHDRIDAHIINWHRKE